MMKILTASVLGVVGIAASTAALAMSANTSSTYCKPGFYAGIEGGRGDTYYNQTDIFGNAAVSNQEVDDIGMSGRLFAGYQINPYFALETGFTQFNKTDFSGNATVDGIPTTINGDITERAVDLVGKATLPMQGGFGAFLELGGALITTDTSVNTTLGLGASGSKQAIRPVYGAGLDYTIPNTPLDFQVFYREVSGRGFSSDIKTASMWGAGLAYKFA